MKAAFTDTFLAAPHPDFSWLLLAWFG